MEVRDDDAFMEPMLTKMAAFVEKDLMRNVERGAGRGNGI
jgi:hypothetical protein